MPGSTGSQGTGAGEGIRQVNYQYFSGFIIDSLTNKPIIGAKVRINGFKTITDSLGFFTLPLENNSSQILAIEVFSDGYVPTTKEMKVGYGYFGKMKEPTFKLLPDPKVKSKRRLNIFKSLLKLGAGIGLVYLIFH